MADFGLDIEAARIETHALADQGHFRLRLLAKSEIDETRRLFGGAADGVNERQIGFEKLIAPRDPRMRQMLRSERDGRLFERVRVHVIGGGIDEIAAELHVPRDALDPRRVDSLRNAKARPAAAIGFVAAEPVEGEEPSERGQRGIMRLVGEAVEAGGQRCRHLAWKKEIAHAGRGAFYSEKNAGDRAIGARHDVGAAGRWLEPAGAREGLRRFGKTIPDLSAMFPS